MNTMMRARLEVIAKQILGMELALLVMMLTFFLLVCVLQ